MLNKNTNYLLAIIIFIVSIYSVYTKYYLSSAGWFLLGLSLVLIGYLSKIEADRKYYIIMIPLPVLAIICFLLEAFY